MEIETILYKKRKRKTKYTKTGKVRSKSRQELERELWKAFSLYIRKRDGMRCVMRDEAGHTCYGAIQCGHLIGRTKLATKYHEMNCHAQCAGANYSHQYRPELYIAWFIRKHGADKYLELTTLSAQKVKALSTAECQKLTALYSRKVKELHVQ